MRFFDQNRHRFWLLVHVRSQNGLMCATNCQRMLYISLYICGGANRGFPASLRQVVGEGIPTRP